MPIRMLRDWTDSEALHAVGEHGESFFVRLIMKADDYGLYPADPRLLKSQLYPIREDLRVPDILRRLLDCEAAHLVAFYEVSHTGGSRWLAKEEAAAPCAEGVKRFLEIQRFCQRIRDDVGPKYPLPPAGTPPGFPPNRREWPRPAADSGGSQPYAYAPALAQSEALSTSREHAREATPENGDGDATDAEIRRWIGGQTSLMYDRKMHSLMRKLVDSAGWDRAKELVGQAVAKGVALPVGYALQVHGSQQAKAGIADGDKARGKAELERKMSEAKANLARKAGAK